MSETEAETYWVPILTRIKQEQTGDPNAKFIVKRNIKCEEKETEKVKGV